MAKVVNVQNIDNETFYLVRLTPQEIAPLLPTDLDAEKLPEGQVFVAVAEHRDCPDCSAWK
jgi:hypothetical protein